MSTAKKRRATIPDHEPAFVKFTATWKVDWNDFKNLSSKIIEKHFTTSDNNVVLRWTCRIEFNERTQDDKFAIYLYYIDGPIIEFNDMYYTIQFLRSDKNLKSDSRSTSRYKAQRGLGRGWSNFDARDIVEFQKKYGLENTKYLQLQLTLKVPISAFTESYLAELEIELEIMAGLARATENSAMAQLYKCIDSPDKSSFWNCKLRSRDGDIFYCDQCILGQQSEVLKAMFVHSERENKEFEYPFPNLGTPALKALLAYLYQREVPFAELHTNSIFEVADATEQYFLTTLKRLCNAVLWQRVIDKPEDGFIVYQFADLHEDFKYLKDRAMDILADNYEKFELHSIDDAKFGDGDTGKRLHSEFNKFSARRLTPRF